MFLSRLSLGAALVLGLSSIWLASASSSQSAQSIARVSEGIPVRWGLVLESERPFYSAGDTLHARYVLANDTAQAVATWSLAAGGNGCAYRFTLLDAAGALVWQPGSLQGGVFSAPPCSFGSRATTLLPHSFRQASAEIPLVYQNAAGLGPQGQALPPGSYQLAVEVDFFGPERPPASFSAGLSYSARVPIRIE